MNKIKNFKAAFDAHVGTCSAFCVCGRQFYNPNRYDWDWADGEIEALESNNNATAIDDAVSYVSFEGREYVAECDCWHERAERIMGFLDGHGCEIAQYFKLEKERKIAEAEAAPIVE